jgi:hemerythrin-like metal-binding protein
MDDDHMRLEKLLGTVAGVTDEALPALLAVLEAEIRAHFAREEELMEAHGVEIYSCHVVQHRLFLAELAQGHAAAARADTGELRRFLADRLPRLLEQHVDTVDRVTASFLRSAVEELSPHGMRRAANSGKRDHARS